LDIRRARVLYRRVQRLNGSIVGSSEHPNVRHADLINPRTPNSQSQCDCVDRIVKATLVEPCRERDIVDIQSQRRRVLSERGQRLSIGLFAD
jgi:hypothetical protein